MAYIRKTVDEFDIEMLSNEGWEIVDCRPTRKEARASVKEYRENQPEYDYRINHHRVKIEPPKKYYQNYNVVQTYSECGLVTAQHNESLKWLVMYGDRILKSFNTKLEADSLAVALSTSGLVMMPGYLYNVTLQGSTVGDRVAYLRSIS